MVEVSHRLVPVFALAAMLPAGLSPAAATDARLPLGINEVLQEQTVSNHPYTGLWVTEDGHVRHELLPTGRYVEARGKRERAYEGRYWVTGDHIDYKDDTGFTADGDFSNGILYHGGMVLYRK